MPLPRTPPITTPGPAGFIEWLQREAAMGAPQAVAFLRRLKDHAPHLITQAVHGLADPGYIPRGMGGYGGGPSMLYNRWRGPGLSLYDRGPRMMGRLGDSTDLTVDPSTFSTPGIEAPTDLPTITPSADPTAPGSGSGGWADTIAQLATPVITGVEQIKLFNTQLSLAQQGRPPLNVSQLRLPTVPVRVGFGFGGGTIPGWAIGGGIIAAALLFFRGGRRA